MTIISAINGRHLSGWKKDKPDARDFLLAPLPPATLPPSIDLRPKFQPIPIEDQGQLGSCTANALARVMEYGRVAFHKLPEVALSRLFIYYNERALEGTINQDAGAELRDGCKTLTTQGVCLESIWPYSDDAHTFKNKPSPVAVRDAVQNKAISYHRCLDHTAIKTALSQGFPVVLGTPLYSSFESAAVEKSGRVPMPKGGEQIIGGHAMHIVGYSDVGQDSKFPIYIVGNSWGSSWGLAGYCIFPQKYFDLPAVKSQSDFWAITAVNCEGDKPAAALNPAVVIGSQPPANRDTSAFGYINERLNTLSNALKLRRGITASIDRENGMDAFREKTTLIQGELNGLKKMNDALYPEPNGANLN